MIRIYDIDVYEINTSDNNGIKLIITASNRIDDEDNAADKQIDVYRKRKSDSHPLTTHNSHISHTLDF
jgi:hypothetical protein